MSEDPRIAFLRARWDEAEARAKQIDSYSGCCSGCHCGCLDTTEALADIASKRRILARHQPHSMGSCRVCEAPHWGVRVCDHCYGRQWPCPDVLDLALPYADHPDFREEWRP